MLQWLRANGCPWDKNVCNSAASDGNLEMLQWARANGCPWDNETSTSAKEGGHLDVLKWARANGCPAPKHDLDDVTRGAAAADGSCLDVVNAVFMGRPQGEDANGINVQTVISALNGRFTSGQVLQAVELLVNDGHLYSTIDDAHFRSTLL